MHIYFIFFRVILSPKLTRQRSRSFKDLLEKNQREYEEQKKKEKELEELRMRRRQQKAANGSAKHNFEQQQQLDEQVEEQQLEHQHMLQTATISTENIAITDNGEPELEHKAKVEREEDDKTQQHIEHLMQLAEQNRLREQEQIQQQHQQKPQAQKLEELCIQTLHSQQSLNNLELPNDELIPQPHRIHTQV